MIQRSQASPRRQRRRDRRKQEILTAALRVVTDEGLDALTVHHLAKRLDYTPGALYRYFPAKEALLAELERRAVVTLHEALGAAWQRVDAFAAARTVSKKLRALLYLSAVARVYALLPAVAPEAVSLFTQALADPRRLVPDEHYGPVVAALQTLLASLAERLAGAAEAGALAAGSDAERVVILVAAAHGSSSIGKLSRAAPKRFRFEDGALEPHVAALLAGWGATPATLRDAAELMQQLERERPLLEASSLTPKEVTP
jgi:AcrR family transcriptional regulator